MWQTEMLDLLRSGDEASWNRAFLVKQSHVPDRLYKYRAPTPLSLEMLSNGMVWFSAARSFNDPFDSSISFNGESILRARILEELEAGRITAIPKEEQARLAGTSLPLPELMAELFSFDPQITPELKPRVAPTWKAIIASESADLAAAIRPRFQDVKVCSFSTDGNSLPMWAHYAKDHSGYCVEYPLGSLSAEDARRKWSFPVQYDDQRFDLSPWLGGARKDTNSTKHFTMLPLLASLHKAVAWAYEREWRMVHIGQIAEAGIAIRLPLPSAIYFGCRMDPAFRAELMTIAKASKIPTLEMRLCETSYAIAPVPVET